MARAEKIKEHLAKLEEKPKKKAMAASSNGSGGKGSKYVILLCRIATFPHTLSLCFCHLGCVATDMYKSELTSGTLSSIDNLAGRRTAMMMTKMMRIQKS